MKLKHHKDFPKEKKVARDCQGYLECDADGFNQALDICGEIEVLERLDEEKIRQSLIRDEACLKFCPDRELCSKHGLICRHFTGQIIHKKFGTSKEG